MKIEIEVKDNATNEDIIKSLFPTMYTNTDKLREPEFIYLCSNGTIQAKIYTDWWNAKFKRE